MSLEQLVKVPSLWVGYNIGLYADVPVLAMREMYALSRLVSDESMAALAIAYKRAGGVD